MKLSSFVVLIMLIFISGSEAAAPVKKPKSAPVMKTPKVLLSTKARRLLFAKDYLGFRIFIKKSYSEKMSQNEWYQIKNLVALYAQRSGFDLIPFWNARNTSLKDPIDAELDQADSLMLAGRFQEAFKVSQEAAKKIKPLTRTRADARALLPFAFHMMGRALYGAKRYDEALQVYQWIGSNYPFFRQTLFEKMWAAFKAGRVEYALGAIASQRSSYFSKYLPTEAYLLQTYLYKKLCREEDLKQVFVEMKDYEAVLSRGNLKDWVSKDVTTQTLWTVSQIKPSPSDVLTIVSAAERNAEQRLILETLKKVYEKQKTTILNDLKAISAYAQLTNVSDAKTVLKPIEKLTSREALLKQDLEIWPAENAEEWVDELGKHVLMGESLCKPEE